MSLARSHVVRWIELSWIPPPVAVNMVGSIVAYMIAEGSRCQSVTPLLTIHELKPNTDVLRMQQPRWGSSRIEGAAMVRLACCFSEKVSNLCHKEYK
jgi:hypothetical protein